MWPRTSPPCSGGLRRSHVSRGLGPHLTAEVGSGAATWPTAHGPRTHLPPKVGSRATTCPAALDLTSLKRWALVLPCVVLPQISPHCRGELWRCHVSHGPGPHLPAEVGSDAATYPTAPNLASLPRWTPALPCVPRPWDSPPCRGGLRHYHVPHGPKPPLLAEIGSGAATCPAALDLASLPRWPPALPRVPRPRTSPPYRGGLQRCHVSHGPGPHLPAEVGSDVAMCPVALGLTSLLRWALALSRAPWLQTSPPCRDRFGCCHISRGPGPRLPAEVFSGAATCPTALDLTSLPRWAPALPCVPRPRTSPPCRGEL
jgi:hypothetical protein